MWRHLMASRPDIIYVGGMTGSAAGSTTDDAFTLTLTGGIASAPSAGDVVVVAAATASTVDRGYRISGYTQVSDLHGDDTYDTNLWLGYKVLTGADASFTITGGSGAADDSLAVCAMVFRNINSLAPVNSVIAEEADGGNAEPGNPSITLTGGIASVAIMAGAGAHRQGYRLFTKDPTPSAEKFITAARDGTNDVSLGLLFRRATSGTVTFPIMRFSGSLAGTDSSAAASFALKRA